MEDLLLLKHDIPDKYDNCVICAPCDYDGVKSGVWVKIGEYIRVRLPVYQDVYVSSGILYVMYGGEYQGAWKYASSK